MHAIFCQTILTLLLLKNLLLGCSIYIFIISFKDNYSIDCSSDRLMMSFVQLQKLLLFACLYSAVLELQPKQVISAFQVLA